MKQYRILKEVLNFKVSDQAKLIYIYLFDQVIISQISKIKLPSVRTISEKLNINKNYISNYIHELNQANLITTELNSDKTKVYVSVNLFDTNSNQFEPITDTSVWLSRDNGASAQYAIHPYKLVSEEFLGSDLSAGKKIVYCCYKHCCDNANIKTFSSKIICSESTFSINEITAKRYLLDLEKQGWINLQLVNPNIPRLGYKSITFNDTPVIKERAKLNQSQFISNEIKEEIILEKLNNEPIIDDDTSNNEPTVNDDSSDNDQVITEESIKESENILSLLNGEDDMMTLKDCSIEVRLAELLRSYPNPTNEHISTSEAINKLQKDIEKMDTATTEDLDYVLSMMSTDETEKLTDNVIREMTKSNVSETLFSLVV